MAKFYISAGHSANDPGAVKHVAERDQVWEISNMVAEELRALGHIAYRDKWEYSWRQTVDEANKLGVHYFFEYHENAGGGKGAEVIIYALSNQYIADMFKAAFAEAGQNWRRTIVDPSFWVLKYTNAKACIVEVAFVDNLYDIQQFDETYEKRRLARIHAKHMDKLARADGHKPENPPKPAPVPKPQMDADALYRVQVGAFKEKSNAEAMLKKIKNAGFSAFITSAENLYKVQVGAFKEKSNADNMLAKIKVAGFDAFVSGTTASASKPTPAPQRTIKVGSTVRVRKGAKSYEGTELANFIYNRNHVVYELNGNRVVITYSNVVVAAVNIKDLILM